MKCNILAKILLQCILIVTLIFLTTLRMQKLWQEETSLSYSKVNQKIQLPSMTICLRRYDDFAKAPKMDETVTFDEFMESSKSVKDILVGVKFSFFGPNDKNKVAYDLLTEKYSDIFEESYFLNAFFGSYYGLNRCLTINNPISDPIVFKDAFVS